MKSLGQIAYEAYLAVIRDEKRAQPALPKPEWSGMAELEREAWEASVNAVEIERRAR